MIFSPFEVVQLDLAVILKVLQPTVIDIGSDHFLASSAAASPVQTPALFPLGISRVAVTGTER